MNIATEETLREITKAIIDAVHPVKVILFGSYARGDVKPDSDLDFLIVKEEPFNAARSRREEIGAMYRLLKDFMIPMDILIYSKSEFERRSGWKNHVIGRTNREGRVLYERK